MYLRISTIVEGKVDEYYSPEKIDAVANEDLDDLKVEIDIFKGEYNGLIFAEIEFPSEEDAKNIKLPEGYKY